MNHLKSAHFRAAAHKEMRALLSKHTWDEVQKPSQTKTLPTKWVFLYKEDADGYVTKFKVCLCARGDLQLGVNKDDVSAIIVESNVRFLMILSRQFKESRWPLHLPPAYLNGEGPLTRLG